MKKITLLLALSCLVLLPEAQAASARIMMAYTSRASNLNGGAGNLQATLTNCITNANAVHNNSQTLVDWYISRWYATGLGDQRSAGSILSDTANHAGMLSGARGSNSNIICITADSTDVGGLAYQPGQVALVDAEPQHVHYPYYSHEIGHNYNADHNHGICWGCNGVNRSTIMKLNYCGSGYSSYGYYTNPTLYRNCRYIGDSSHNNTGRIKDIRNTRSSTGF